MWCATSPSIRPRAVPCASARSARETGSMQSLRNEVARLDGAIIADAAAWGIPAAAARLLLALPLLAVVALVLAVPHPWLYHFLIDEDHVIEWSQFAAILAASVAFALAARWTLKAGRRSLAVLFLFVAVGAFVVAGEEISWGQRILGFLTPDALRDINHQGEANIHNISSLQRVFNLGELLVGLYGFGVPLLWANRTVRTRLRLDRLHLDPLLIPPLCLATLFFLPFAYRAFRAIFLPTAGERITEFGELPELTLYLGILIVALVILRAQRRRMAARQA
jgi:hypothetical protein